MSSSWLECQLISWYQPMLIFMLNFYKSHFITHAYLLDTYGILLTTKGIQNISFGSRSFKLNTCITIVCYTFQMKLKSLFFNCNK